MHRGKKVIGNIVSGLGKKRIDHVLKMKDYFTDLELDYHFFKQLNGYKIKIDGAWHQYNHIAKVLNRNNRFAWGIKYIDSNYDGMVNPLNGFRTYKRECMRFFEEEFLNPKWISLKAKRMYLGFC